MFNLLHVLGLKKPEPVQDLTLRSDFRWKPRTREMYRMLRSGDGPVFASPGTGKSTALLLFAESLSRQGLRVAILVPDWPGEILLLSRAKQLFSDSSTTLLRRFTITHRPKDLLYADAVLLEDAHLLRFHPDLLRIRSIRAMVLLETI